MCLLVLDMCGNSSIYIVIYRETKFFYKKKRFVHQGFSTVTNKTMLDFVVGMGKNWLTKWSTERMFTFSSRVLLLQSRQRSCLLRNENIIIFTSYQIYKLNIAVKNTYKLQISYFQVIQV